METQISCNEAIIYHSHTETLYKQGLLSLYLVGARWWGEVLLRVI